MAKKTDSKKPKKTPKVKAAKENILLDIDTDALGEMPVQEVTPTDDQEDQPARKGGPVKLIGDDWKQQLFRIRPDLKARLMRVVVEAKIEGNVSLKTQDLAINEARELGLSMIEDKQDKV